VLVEYGPGGYSPGHTHAKSAFIYLTVLEGAIRSQVNDGPVTTYEAGRELLRIARRPPQCQRQCQQDKASQAPRGVRGGHERDGADDPIRELRFNIPKLPHDANERGAHEGTQTGHSTFAPRRLTVAPDRRSAFERLAAVNSRGR
jgi:hypothetical protein